MDCYPSGNGTYLQSTGNYWSIHLSTFKKCFHSTDEQSESTWYKREVSTQNYCYNQEGWTLQWSNFFLCWYWTKEESKFILTLRNCLWYINGHHQTLSDRSHRIPAIFEAFKDYNVPKLTKHCILTWMQIIILKKHAGYLKEFLLSPWMKQQKCTTIKAATEQLAESVDGYGTE